MLKKATAKLKSFNDEVEQRAVMVRVLKGIGIPISSRITTKNLVYMFVKVVEMQNKPYYDGVIERLMLHHVKSD